jgi:cellulose synthase/poly-beta-1,6-N-acetylglucosamine synthase-like glycosyltransferase/peptidoglycan/xylan/chitin deacetylase (PgdA/CDA1 family)/spore germination protein YaaH
MQEQLVFYDPTQQRRRRLKQVLAALLLFFGVVSTLFVISLLLVPVLPSLPAVSAGIRRSLRKPLVHLPSRQTKLRRHLLARTRTELLEQIALDERRLRVHASLPPSPQVVAAFYTTWQETGLHSLRANADKLTHLMPEWLHLTRDGKGLDTYEWNPELVPHNRDVVQIAKQHGVDIVPVLNNAEHARFDPYRVHRLLTDDRAQAVLALQIRDWLLSNGFHGINVDFENLMPDDYIRLARWLRYLAGVLHARGLLVTADIEANVPVSTMQQVAASCDFVVLMAYDQHYAGSQPGPIAALPWTREVLTKALKVVPPEKLVLGIGNYAYDWPDASPPAETLTFQEAILRAQENHPDEPPQRVVDFDAGSLNPTFTYADDGGKLHEVWLLDAVTAANQWLLASRMGLRGGALWLLGSEDPSLWNLFRRASPVVSISPSLLERITYPYDIEFVGSGEILSVVSLPREGARTVEVDDSTGICTDEEYVRFPSTFIIQRQGFHPKWLVLTFDDGPSVPYTEQILDELKRLGVRATFFIIGENAEQYPDIVRRIWEEGHEIGSHTFTHPNMGAVSERRARLELSATQRVLQSILGRSTVLFRPPYNADAEPSSAEEVRPILIASQLGYLTVGELIDPQDWNIRPHASGHTVHPRTAEDIAAEVIRLARAGTGNVILLHDGGGDRSRTVQALRLIVPNLQRMGFRFVTVSELLSTSRETLMPPLSTKEMMLVGVDRVVFELNYSTDLLLRIAFLGAIGLAMLRVATVVPLALWGAWCERKGRLVPYRPSVSVLIAAYNERNVIGRTIQAVLDGGYEPLEVIVVDDGSQDGTAEEVARLFGDHPQVRLIRQPNSGKAAALNHGLRYATGEVIVALDADTLFLPDTIHRLAQRFRNPRVGAVAGNVKVGNRINVLTRWQAIEYITSQNLDRRAFAVLNAVTVVPGAVGAWRREAVLQVDGYRSDTMAEDMDLTWRLRRAGWRVETANDAIGLTEAPDTLKGLFRQRFRWAYGTLQCLWKHRDALGRYGFFGWVMLPSLWLFQVVFQVLSPLVDLQIVWTLANVGQSWLTRGLLTRDWQPLPQAVAMLAQIGFLYALFFAVELLASIVAFRLDRERMHLLWWLFWQRFVYRQLMYAVMLKSVLTALQGVRAGWGKVERKGTVQVGGR